MYFQRPSTPSRRAKPLVLEIVPLRDERNRRRPGTGKQELKHLEQGLGKKHISCQNLNAERSLSHKLLKSTLKVILIAWMYKEMEDLQVWGPQKSMGSFGALNYV